MRLRRETGDFQIEVISGAANTIRNGLSAEDFVGELVNVDGVYEVISSASNGEGTVTAKSESYILTYNKGTGAITAEQNSGGGSGGGSGLVIEGGVYAYHDAGDASYVTFSNPAPTGLTASDLVGAKVIIDSPYDDGGQAVMVHRIMTGLIVSAVALQEDDLSYAEQSWFTGEEIIIAIYESGNNTYVNNFYAYRPSTGEIFYTSL